VLALLFALAFLLTACGNKATNRATELGEFENLVPPHGVYVRLFTAEGERWSASYNQPENRILVNGVWRKKGSPWQMNLSPERSDVIWKMALRLLDAPVKAFHYDPDMRIEIAISDGDRALVLKAHGPFVEGAARDLYEGIKGWVPDPATATEMDQR
jgi:hypothetical protein